VNLEDILSIEKWADLEKKINHKFGLFASVFDTNGVKITGFKKYSNSLCRSIQANEKGRSFICTVANQNLSQQARQTKKPVLAECDAGLLKLVVPIFVGAEFLGVLSGCGLLVNGGSVETFLIHKTTGVNIGEIDRISNDINQIQTDKIGSIVDNLIYSIDDIIADFYSAHSQYYKFSSFI